jgi:hypothetical protein
MCGFAVSVPLWRAKNGGSMFGVGNEDNGNGKVREEESHQFPAQIKNLERQELAQPTQN